MGIRWVFVSGFANDMCVLRGLQTLADAGLAVQVQGSVDLSQVTRLVPGLRLI